VPDDFLIASEEHLRRAGGRFSTRQRDAENESATAKRASGSIESESDYRCILKHLNPKICWLDVQVLRACRVAF
jgi:hypothetical protein